MGSGAENGPPAAIIMKSLIMAVFFLSMLGYNQAIDASEDSSWI